MNTKRFISIALILVLAFSFVACNNNVINPPVTTPHETPSGNDDPCPCCPDCIQEDCECEECADSKDCKCGSGSLDEYPPLTYDVEIHFELMHDGCGFDDCGFETIGRARVMMDYIDSTTGYSGSSPDGSGNTFRNANHEVENKNALAPGDLPDYDFTAQLSIPADKKVIRVGVNRLGPDEATYDWSAFEGLGIHTSPTPFNQFLLYMFEQPNPFEYGAVVYPEPDTGLLIFEVPLIEGTDMQGQQYKWDNIFISITLTPVNR